MRFRRHLAVLTAATVGAGLATVLAPSPASAGVQWATCGSIRCINGTTVNQTPYELRLGLPGEGVERGKGFTPQNTQDKYDADDKVYPFTWDKWTAGVQGWIDKLDVNVTYNFKAGSDTYVVAWYPTTAWGSAGGDRNSCFVDKWEGFKQWNEQAHQRTPMQANGAGTPFECMAPTPEGGYVSNVTLTLKAR
ncbi:hypothetical protein [Streptomyces sp. NPDC008121]|uniref:hypothetical protein n=1 Tax=Streptomyces sp. NPDC008121 TaxID=3364809 RepID=UPI0036EDAFFE